MSLGGSSLEDLFRWISGSDPEYFFLEEEISTDERRIARAYSVINVGITVINFICTFLSIHYIFKELQISLGEIIYTGLIVIPISVFWSLLLFNLLRFSTQAGYEHDENTARKFFRILLSSPVWLVFPVLGFAAAIPLQTAALSNDIRFESVSNHWNNLSPALLEVHLKHVDGNEKPYHACIEPSLTPQIFNDINTSFSNLQKCEETVKNSSAGDAIDFDPGYSLRLIETIRIHLYADGLITQSSMAFQVAPGASWLLAMVMMLVFSATSLTRILARKRPFDYWRTDFYRRWVARLAHIEIHAHEVFDAKGKQIPLNRHHGAEFEQLKMEKIFTERKKQEEFKLKNNSKN